MTLKVPGSSIAAAFRSDRRPPLEGTLEGHTPRHVFLKHCRRHWGIYTLGLGSVVLTNFADVATPKVIQWTVDLFNTTQGDQAWSQFLPLFWGLIGLFIVQLIGRIGWRLFLGQQTHRVGASMKSLLWDHARYLPKHRLQRDLNPGELMNAATGDVNTGRFLYGFTLVITIDFVFLLVLTTVAMLTIDVSLTLYALAVLPFLPLVLDRLARRESLRHKEAQDSLSQLTELASQSVAASRQTRVSHTGSFWSKRLNEAAAEYQQKRLQVIRTTLAFIPVSGLAPLLSFLVLMALGLDRVLSGQLSVGAFLAMQAYVFKIQAPLQELGQLVSEWQRGWASLDRLHKIFKVQEHPRLRSGGLLQRSPDNLSTGGQSAIEATKVDTVYTVRNLEFGFSDDRRLWEPLSFEVKKGEKLGVRGPIGVGKSTLLELLGGFEENYQGDIQLWGQDIRSYSHALLRKHLAVVPQKPFLFATTLRKNVAFSQDLSDDEIWHWLRTAGLEHDVEQMPRGLDTPLGEWGINLSGGQKQRLTLARALAAHPSVLLLDDCLSAVDTITEEKILRALEKELSELTVIWVAHRESTLKSCTRILNLPSRGAVEWIH